MNAATKPADPGGLDATRCAKLATRAIAKCYGRVDALHPTDLDVAAGEFLTVLGPSGSGKTTLLQLVAGLVEPSGGRIYIDGRDETDLPSHQRDIGVVFQSYALFPHMTVAENVGFPLRMRRLPGAELRRRVDVALAMVDLGPLADRFPRELSGGQQQRVALARCFVYEPALILMDEPLSALDRKLRESMQGEIRRLHRETGATILFVTHDQEEALALSDRICLMNEGRIEQIGAPAEIYEAPETLFAADFIGLSNVLPGQVGADGVLLTASGPLALPPGTAAVAGEQAALVVRPEHVALQPAQDGGIRGTVRDSVYAGSELRVVVALDAGGTMTSRRAPHEPRFAPGSRVSLAWPAARARLLRA